MAEMKRILFRCPDDLFQRLDVEAKKQGMDRTSFVNAAINNYIVQSENLRAYPHALTDYVELVKRVEALEKRS